MIHNRQSRKCVRMRLINVKSLPVAQATFMDHGQHLIFCSFGRSDLNFHVKKVNA